MSHASFRECLVRSLAEIESEVLQSREAGEGVRPELAEFGGGEGSGQAEVQFAEAGELAQSGEKTRDELGVEENTG